MAANPAGEHFDVLIVGAGQAGAQTAISLRQGGFDGTILIIGDEPDLPYERPPLSKEYLAGEKEAARLLLRPADFWAQRNIVFRLGAHVHAVDAHAHEAALVSGEKISYGSLVWAAGGFPRPLPCPGADLDGVHVIRTRMQVDALRRDIEEASSVVVIGGGYIGLEAAAVLVKAGKRLTVVEALDRVLARVTCAQISRFYEAEHRSAGVDVRLSTSVQALIGKGRKVTGVRLGDGQEIAADVVIVGIGLVPHVAPLVEAGAKCSNGVEVDEYCRSSLPDVFAIGDCANHLNPFAGGAHVRLESVQNAIDQAKVAANAILGKPQPYHIVPWFWSNQYDLKLQTIGLCTGFDQVVTRGDPATRSFSLVYLRKGHVVALDCINAARDFVQGKALVEQGLAVAPAALADIGTPLKAHAAMHANETA